MTAPAYNDASFRQQFPAFANETAFPEETLSFAWTMGGNWLSQQCSPAWGLNSVQLQQAADLMGAVIVRQLFGPTRAAGETTITSPSAAGGIAGPLNSASDNGTTASYTLPAFGSSAFSSLLLSNPPYGPLLLALLQTAASVGPYIGSGRPAFVPP